MSVCAHLFGVVGIVLWLFCVVALLRYCLLARVMFYKLKQTVSLFSDQVFVIAAIEDLKNLQFEKFLHLKLDQREAKSPINFHARMHSSTNYGKRI